MELDLFTIAAQIINFLILIVLLKVLLYDRILGVMDEREKRIAARLEEAKAREEQAASEKESFELKQRTLEQQKEAYLAGAREEADEQRRAMLEQAREEADRTKRRWEEAIREERKEFMQELRRRAGERVLSVSRRVLSDMADRDLERQVVATFLNRLRDMEQAERSSMAGAARDADGPITLQSAFDLPEELRQQVRRGVREAIDGEAEVSFHTDTELVCGIDLRVGGRQLSWGFDSYLDALEEGVGDLIEQRAGREDRGDGDK